MAIGEPGGLRSTVWKFWVNGDDVYIQSRMFGSDVKVSIHASGQCQWSCTGEWVKKDATRKNADRHMQRWRIDHPPGREALHFFKIGIPESELRIISASESLGAVQWIPAPPEGYAVAIDCYMTPVVDIAPSAGASLPNDFLASLPLKSGRWLVLLCRVAPISRRDLDDVRSDMLGMIRSAGITLEPQHRISAFLEDTEGIKGMLELCVLAPDCSGHLPQ